MNNHFYGHQKAVVLNNIVIATLSFAEHTENSEISFSSEYDEIVDLCVIDQDAFIGDIWDGHGFKSKPYPSWLLSKDLDWQAPEEKPGPDYYWDEKSLSWIKLLGTPYDN